MFEMSGDLMKESLHVVRVLSRFSASLRMPVHVMLMRENRRFVGRPRLDMKDAGFAVVNPDDGVCQHDAHRPTHEAVHAVPL